MRCLLLLVALRCACAATKKAYNACRCNDYEKFDNGTIWDRVNCCEPWVPRVVSDDLVKVDGVVYRRVNSSYEQYSAFVAKQVEFPGEDSVLYNADNQYTNLSCSAFSCRSVSVFRGGFDHVCGGGLYPNGDCVEYDAPRDWYAPLCHNSTAIKCVIWVPTRELTGGDWMKGLLVVVSVVGVLVLFVLLCVTIWSGNDANSAGCVDLVMMITWWLFSFILSEITVIALCRLNEWLLLTEVDMDYITYQTCIRECSQFADTSINVARVNQCEDRGVSCGGALSAGAAVSCRSCQSHRSDWVNLVVFAWFLKALAIYHWGVFFMYTLAIRNRATWNGAVVWATLLPPLGVFIACAVLTSEMALYGVHGLSAYFMPLGLSSVYDIGLSWTICMCVWWAIFTLGKCIALGQKQVERRNVGAAAGNFVFCFC